MYKKTNSKISNDKYLGEGSFGCVLKPEVPCLGKAVIINKTSNTEKQVSKIFTHKEDFNKEINASKTLQKVDPTGTNILLPYKSCQVSYNDITKNKQAYNCEELEYSKKRDIYQLVMPYGGVRYDEYIKQYKPSLKAFFSITEPLFKALLLLEKNNICHYDIRGANVLVGNNKKAIIIDHSLIIPYSNLYSEKNLRRLKKPYYPYPPECIVYYKIYMDKDIETNYSYISTQFEDSIRGYGENRYDAYKSLVNMKDIKYGLQSTIKSLTTILQTTKTNGVENVSDYKTALYNHMSAYANRVDIYSVGMLIVTIYNYIDYANVSESIKTTFIQFIKDLINPNVYNRLRPKEAYVRFNTIYASVK